MKIGIFTGMKNRCMLHGLVFVMQTSGIAAPNLVVNHTDIFSHEGAHLSFSTMKQQSQDGFSGQFFGIFEINLFSFVNCCYI